MKKILSLLFLSIAFNVHGQNCIPNTSSVLFDGVSSYINMPANSALDITDYITIEAWINSDYWGFSSAQNTIVCKHGWYTGEAGYVLRAGGTGELSFNISGLDSIIQWRDVISNANALQLNTWYHVAGTFDGNELKIYINGTLAGTNAFQGSIVNSASYNLKIGKLADENQFETRYWSGMIDEVRIWNRALSQSEIYSNMNNHIDPLTATNLVAYWRLNDSPAISVLDMGTSNTTGTLQSANWSTDVPFSDGPPVPTITPGGPYLYSSSPVNNQWNLNGVPIPNENFLSIVPVQNGSYTVTVTDSTGCSVTSAPYVVTTLGIDNVSLIDLIEVQNLSDEMLRFISPSQVLKKAEIKLLDINGKIVNVKVKGSSSNEMDLRSLAAGVYILWIQVDNASYKSKVVLN